MAVEMLSFDQLEEIVRAKLAPIDLTPDLKAGLSLLLERGLAVASSERRIGENANDLILASLDELVTKLRTAYDDGRLDPDSVLYLGIGSQVTTRINRIADAICPIWPFCGRREPTHGSR
jgi:hypothetical protein